MSVPYRRAYRTALPDVGVVVDPFHVVQAANTALNQVRCAEQKLALSKGVKRKDHPLYQGRELLTMGKEKLTEDMAEKLRACLAVGDPYGRVLNAYNAKELIRSIYTTTPENTTTGNDTATVYDHVARVQQIADRSSKTRIPCTCQPTRTHYPQIGHTDRQLVHRTSQQRPHRSTQQPHKTPQTHRLRLHKLRQLQNPNTTIHKQTQPRTP